MSEYLRWVSSLSKNFECNAVLCTLFIISNNPISNIIASICMLQPYCLILFLTFHRWEFEVQTKKHSQKWITYDGNTNSSVQLRKQGGQRLQWTSQSHYPPQQPLKWHSCLSTVLWPQSICSCDYSVRPKNSLKLCKKCDRSGRSTKLFSPRLTS